MNNSAKFMNVDDEYEGAGKRKKSGKDNEFVRREVNDEDEPCENCAIHFPPHLLLFYNERVYVCGPRKAPLVDKQVIIRPLGHAASLIEAGEEVAADVNQIRHILSAMYAPYQVVFVETYFRSHRWQKHFQIQCFPILPKHADQLRMSFRKSISECEHEWSVNRKLIKIDKPVTRCVSLF
jgi:hypothetical protein